jgi:hypothetical protein
VLCGEFHAALDCRAQSGTQSANPKQAQPVALRGGGRAALGGPACGELSQDKERAMKKLFSLFAVCALAIYVVGARAGEKTYKPDDEGFIRNWLVLDTIQLDEKASDHSEESDKPFFDKDFFPGQKKAAPKDGDKVKVDNKDLAWKATQFDDALCMFSEQDNSLYLAVTYVTSDSDVDSAKLKIGSDDSSMWLVNGNEVLRVSAGRAVEKDQDTSKAFKLLKGCNTILAEVINGGGPTGMCCRIVDKDDKPVKNVTLSLTPPAK